MVAVPQRLEHRVGEAEDEQVLHRLLAEVVVDAVDLLLVEPAVHERVELARRGEVAPERLLDDEARPALARRLVEPRLPERRDDRRKRGRRQREIEHAAADEAVLLLDLLDAPGERLEVVAT